MKRIRTMVIGLGILVFAWMMSGCAEKKTTENSSRDITPTVESTPEPTLTPTPENSSRDITPTPESTPEPIDERWNYGSVTRPEKKPKKTEIKDYLIKYETHSRGFYDWSELQTELDPQIWTAIEAKIEETAAAWKDSERNEMGSEILKRKYPYEVREDCTWSVVGVCGDWLTVEIKQRVRRFPTENAMLQRTEYTDDNECPPVEYLIYRTFDRNTGEQLSLRDFFYDDVDYVSLMNSEIEKKLLSQENIIAFDGLVPNQEFCISGLGEFAQLYVIIRGTAFSGTYFGLNDVVLYPVPVKNLWEDTIFYNTEFDINSVREDDNLVLPNYRRESSSPTAELIFKEETGDYLGLPGVQRKLYIHKMNLAYDIPEAVINSSVLKKEVLSQAQIKKQYKEDAYQCGGVAKEVLITNAGPYYHIDVYEAMMPKEYIEIDDWSYDGLVGICENGEWYQIQVGVEKKSFLVDSEGKEVTLTFRTLFRDDADYYKLMAEEIYNEYYRYDMEQEKTEEEIASFISELKNELSKMSCRIELGDIYAHFSFLDSKGEIAHSCNYGYRDMYEYMR